LAILYIYGGIYSDVDRISLQSYNQVLDKYGKTYDVILSRFKYYPIMNNDPIISITQSSFLYQCIDGIRKYNTGIMFFDIFCSSGPLFITSQYYSYKEKNIIVLTDEFIPCGLCECSPEIKDSVSFSTFDNNWIDTSSSLVLWKKIYCNRGLFLFLLLFLVLMVAAFAYISKPRRSYFSFIGKTKSK
jgi:mannosyltransferase OCH1-like enzyme